MNSLIVLGILALFIHGVFFDATFFKIYIPLVGVYWIWLLTIFAYKDNNWKRRKITISSWNKPGDPTAYVPIDYDVTELIEYLEKVNNSSNGKNKLTLTYACVKAIGIAFTNGISNVGRIAFGSFRGVDQIDIAILADVKKGKDLVPIVIKHPHSKSLQQISEDVYNLASRAKAGKDEVHNKNFMIANYIPSFLLGPIITIGEYISLNLGWDLPLLNAKGDQYPPIVLTNIGTFGLEAGFAPLPPMANLLCSWMGAVTEKPWIVNGEIKIRKILTIVHTLDHRIGDAAIAVKPLKLIKTILENPKLLETLEYKGNELLNTDVIDIHSN